VAFDVAQVRDRFPALADGRAHLDAAAGTQVPETVITAVADAYRAGLGNLGGTFPSSARSGRVVTECRRAVADLVGGEPDGVVLGPNMTTLTYRMAETLSREWRTGDVVVVSRLDHDANVRPWVQAAAVVGAEVRWAEIDPATGELAADQFDALIDARTRLVAITAASNVLGTRPDVAAITARARAAGALSYVDGVHATPHLPVDIGALGADLYATSAYKWVGPHVGAVVGSPELLGSLRPRKLAPSPDSVPERFERGTLPFADLAGVTAAVEHLADLDPAASGSRRARLLASMEAVAAYEAQLFDHLVAGLTRRPGVTLHGRPARRTPTAYFSVAGLTPHAVAEQLARRGVDVWSGDNYASELVGALGLAGAGGAVRAGVVHYNDVTDVDRLLGALDELAPGRAQPSASRP
jgi:cysteine desulfurase family protein (TIGR01976 family)